jgi:4-amino-4-deoxy-L-arabinose transferase-like glycosyltransferase
MKVTDHIGSFLKAAGETQGIDPLVFGLLYFITIPLFMFSAAWLFRNIRLRKSVLLPALLSLIFLLSAYLYFAASGTVMPPWAYLTIATATAAGTGFAWASLRHQFPERARRKLHRQRKGL